MHKHNIIRIDIFILFYFVKSSIINRRLYSRVTIIFNRDYTR